MFEDLFLLVFSFILALGGLAVAGWEAWGFVTAGSLSIDGLWLALICLSLSAVFGGNIAWSIYTGELKAILHQSKGGQE